MVFKLGFFVFWILCYIGLAFGNCPVWHACFFCINYFGIKQHFLAKRNFYHIKIKSFWNYFCTFIFSKFTGRHFGWLLRCIGWIDRMLIQFDQNSRYHNMCWANQFTHFIVFTGTNTHQCVHQIIHYIQKKFGFRNNNLSHFAYT